jgi:crotonobetainyl-CoA:carnitine CoA-transferase CaiB-like acyl-CoA transferase
VADVAAGSLHAVIGILTAAVHRQETGLGQAIDLSITDASFALNAMNAACYLAGGVEPERERLLLNGGTFYDYYLTKDGSYCAVGSLEPQFRKSLCQGIGRMDLFNASMSESPQDIIFFQQTLKETFATKTLAEWKTIFDPLDACVEPVLKFSEAAEHPQIRARQMVINVPKPDGTSQQQVASPFKFSEFNQQYKFIGVKVGEHTQEVLTQLGIPPAEIKRLQNKGIFG